MIKLTNLEMANAIEALSLANETGKLGYACARNLRKLRDCAKEYTDIRDDNLKTYATRKKFSTGNGGEMYRFIFEHEEDKAAYDKAMAEYDNIEHDFDAYTIPLEMFISGNLTSSQMGHLMWMVTDDAKDAKDGE